MVDEQTVAVHDAIAKVREACDDIETAYGRVNDRAISDGAWERVEAARERLEIAERRLRTLLETRPAPSREPGGGSKASARSMNA